MSQDEHAAADALLGLDGLEGKVQAAASRLRELAAENERLTARVAELEAGAGSSGAAEWRRERDEVRRRVEKLTRRLAELLDESS